MLRVLFGWSGKKQGLLVPDGQDLITKNKITMEISRFCLDRKGKMAQFAMWYLIS